MKHQIIRNHAIVIGIEIHVQLSTKSKMFSCSPAVFGMSPNTCANEIDCGLPGVLPQPNMEAFHKAIQFGLLIGSKINKKSAFDRKNYFYPDLPKGYQITQDREPIVIGGNITLPDHNQKVIRVHHAHLEEDAGKTIHGQDTAGIDLNRAGSTLLEIVSEPDIFSISEALSYLKTVHALVRYLGISDANMQEGSFRADINVSVRKTPESPLGTRAEIKNLNSFRFIDKAVQYEVNRQIDCLEKGEQVVQETRLYHEQSNTTRSMRSKEDAQDYRYFPEPDLCPVIISDEYVSDIRENLPQDPYEVIQTLMTEHNLIREDARMIVFDTVLFKCFEQGIENNIDAKLVANWLTVNLQTLLNKHQVSSEKIPFSNELFIKLLKHIKDGDISGSVGKDVLEEMWQTQKSPQDIIATKGLKQISDAGALTKVVNEILEQNKQLVSDYKGGKHKVFGFFIGQAMKATKGQAKPELLKDIVTKCLRDYEL